MTSLNTTQTSPFINDKYVVLMETNPEEYESWYNFIRVNGNEDAINHLQSQLEKVDFYIIGDDLSTFDLETERPVSYTTAREMCLLDLNPYMPHRLFNGKLQKIDFGFSRRDKNEDMIEKIHEILGYGDIDKFIDDEETFEDEFDTNSDSENISVTASESESESDDEKRVAEKKLSSSNDKQEKVVAKPQNKTEKNSNNSKTEKELSVKSKTK